MKKLDKQTAEQLARFLSNSTSKCVRGCGFLDNETFKVDFNMDFVEAISKIIKDDDLDDFYAEYWIDTTPLGKGNFHYILDFDDSSLVLQGKDGILDCDSIPWKKKLDELVSETFIKLNTEKFRSASSFLEKIEENDYYNPITEQYVFLYNDNNSIAVYSNIDEAEARKLSALANETDEYWGAFLGVGGYIYDAPLNFVWCNSNFRNDGWITTTNYQNIALSELHENYILKNVHINSKEKCNA